MIYKYIKNLSVIFLSSIFIYIIADMLLLPKIFYVSETVVPNIINHNISTGKVMIEDSGLNYRVQFIPSETNGLFS